MKKMVKYLLITMFLLVNQFTPATCPICGHVCDENCEYIKEICQHECEYPIQPLDKWKPWE